MKNNLYLIISEDKTLREFNLHQTLESISYQEDSRVNLDLSVTTFTDLLDEVSMLSMFSNTKVVVADNVSLDKISDSELTYFENYLENPNPNNYLILLTNKVDTRKKSYKLLQKYFTITDDSSFDMNNLNNYVKKILKEQGYQMPDLDLFLQKVGPDFNNINLELNKLMLYKTNDKIITRDDINLLISDNIETVMYEFTNAFFDKNYHKIISMYEQFKKDNIGIDYLISSLAGSIRTNIIIKQLKVSGKSNQEIAKLINKKEFFVKKTLERIYYYSLDELIDLQLKLAEIDKRLKSGQSNVDELEFFLLKK